MINSLVLALVFIILFLFQLYSRRNGTKNRLPPGPRGLPLLGNNLQIARNAPKQLSKWATEYGKLYTIYIANGKPTLVINDAALMKEIFGNMAATTKFGSEILHVLCAGPYGVGSSNGKIWQEQREFCIKSIREFGFGKGSQVEPMVLSQVDLLCECVTKEIREKSGRVHLDKFLTLTAGNTVWTMVTGDVMETEIVDLIQNLIKALQVAAKSGLAFFSWIKYIAPEMSGYNGYVKACESIHKFVRQSFEQHKSQGTFANRSAYDVISAYIKKVEETTNKDSSFYGDEGNKHSIMSIVGLLIAGVETTAVTLNWLIFYLTVHPDVQQKLRAEIEEKIGFSTNPSLKDRVGMPYTEAVIQETLRMASVGPFGLIHELSEDTDFQGCRLPKGLLLIPNIYFIQNDRNVWGDPENFRPERFLETSTRNLKDYIVTFQPGKRACLGESMVKDAIFLFVTKLLQKFYFSPDCGIDKREYLEPDVSYLMLPKKLSVMITETIQL